mmetsp:Transcript_51010/g.100973  ORF Transcript_51010/g.100973 Transcript_51010/m.100973 type:complete len:434 (-) Transcript_51010:618-1919(-)
MAQHVAHFNVLHHGLRLVGRGVEADFVQVDLRLGRPQVKERHRAVADEPLSLRERVAPRGRIQIVARRLAEVLWNHHFELPTHLELVVVHFHGLVDLAQRHVALHQQHVAVSLRVPLQSLDHFELLGAHVEVLVDHELVGALKDQLLHVQARHERRVRALPCLLVALLNQVGHLHLQLPLLVAACSFRGFQALQKRQVEAPSVLIEQTEVEQQGKQRKVQHCVVRLHSRQPLIRRQPPEHLLQQPFQVRVLEDAVAHHQRVLLAALVSAHAGKHVPDRARHRQVQGLGAVRAAGYLDGAVVVEARVVGLEEHFLAANREKSTNVLAENLDVAQVGVLPVALQNVQEVHQRVVLGVGHPLPDLHAHHVLLRQVLGAFESRAVLAEVGARHLGDALLLKLVLHAVRLPLHHLRGVEHRLRQRVYVLFLGIHFRKT